MANYQPSNLVNAQAKLIGMMQKGELRFREPAVFKELIKNASMMYPDYATLRTREDRTVTAYYRKRSSRSLGSARAHNHSGSKGDTGTLTPSWTIYSDKFLISLKQANNNVFTLQEMLNNELENVIANMAEGLESDASDFVFSSRSQVNSATAEGTFNATNYAFEIDSASNGSRAIQITKTMMVANKWTGNLTIFCDEIAYNKFQYLAAQGMTNATNTSFQFNGVKFVNSVELTASAATLSYTKGFWVAAPDGTFAALPWIPKENRQGVDTKVNQYSSIINPVDGLSYAVHTYQATADGSAANSTTQDVADQYEVSIDVAMDVAPLSTANETPLQAVALV